MMNFDFDLEQVVPDGVELTAILIRNIFVAIWGIPFINRFFKALFEPIYDAVKLISSDVASNSLKISEQKQLILQQEQMLLQQQNIIMAQQALIRRFDRNINSLGMDVGGLLSSSTHLKKEFESHCDLFNCWKYTLISNGTRISELNTLAQGAHAIAVSNTGTGRIFGQRLREYERLANELETAMVNLTVKTYFNAEGINSNESEIRILEERLDGDSDDDGSSGSTLIAPRAPRPARAPRVENEYAGNDGDENKQEE